MSPVHNMLVSTRRLLARRPWIQWAAITAVAALVAGSVHARLQQVDQQRDSWGSTRTVLIAGGLTEIGESIDVERRDVPIAMIPDGALGPEDVGGRRTARQRVGAGEIVTRLDVAAHDGPQAMTPAGWLAVPVVESPRSGAVLGDRVQVASDGFVLSTEALVVGLLDEVTLLAVPAEEAPLLPAASAAGALTLLLKP